jgi:hypothetical protein
MLSSRSKKKQRAALSKRKSKKRARFETGVQAVRVRRVGGTRSWNVGRSQTVGRPKVIGQARSRTGRKGRPRTRGAARSEAAVPRDPRVPRFQARKEERGYRPAPHATRVAFALPWARAIPLNGKTVLNVGVLALLGWVLIWLFTSERFYVRHVEAIGNHQVSSEILSQVSGLQGYSVFWINPRRVSAQILAALPPIQSVQVRYGFIGQEGLAGWVRLYVQEHSTEIVWQVAGQSYWVDEEGALHEVRGQEAEVDPAASETDGAQDLPGPRMLIQDLRPGLPDQVDVEALAGARQLARLLPEVRTLEYAPGTGLRLKHPRGWLVYLGTGEDMVKRVGVLRAMEVEFAREGAIQPTVVDLRFPESPYYRLPDDSRPAGAD